MEKEHDRTQRCKVGFPRALSVPPGPGLGPQGLLFSGSERQEQMKKHFEVTKPLSCPLLPPYPGQGGAEGGRFLE